MKDQKIIKGLFWMVLIGFISLFAGTICAIIELGWNVECYGEQVLIGGILSIVIGLYFSYKVSMSNMKIKRKLWDQNN